MVRASPVAPRRSYQVLQCPLQGTVEADETFVGGKDKNKHAKDRKGGTQGGAGKTIVPGMIERDGQLRTVVVTDLKAKTVQTIVRENVAKGSNLMTNEAGSYRGLGRDYHHHTVNHGASEYVLRTNSIESVWVILKRQFIGIHHWVSPKHLTRDAADMTWRFNRRDMSVTDRMNDIFGGMEGWLRHKTLIS
ncbi:MAG: IS1595 family transposase [Microvirga sp.]